MGECLPENLIAAEVLARVRDALLPGARAEMLFPECGLRWRRLTPPEPPAIRTHTLYRDADFGVHRDALSGRLAVASLRAHARGKPPPLTLV